MLLLMSSSTIVVSCETSHEVAYLLLIDSLNDVSRSFIVSIVATAPLVIKVTAPKHLDLRAVIGGGALVHWYHSTLRKFSL